MNRRGLLCLLGLAPIAAVGKAVGLPAPAQPELGHLAGTLSALEPMEIGFIRDTMPSVVVSEELHDFSHLGRWPSSWPPKDAGPECPRAEFLRALNTPASPPTAADARKPPMPDDLRFHGCDVQRIGRRPGDRFVLTTDEILSAEQVAFIKRAWSRFWADGADGVDVPPVFVCSGGLRVAVMSADIDYGKVGIGSPLADGSGL